MHKRTTTVPANATQLHPISGHVADQLDGIADPNSLSTSYLDIWHDTQKYCNVYYYFLWSDTEISIVHQVNLAS